MPTMTHGDCIDTIAGAIRDVPGVRALFLSGSHANGLADAWSDIDFILVSDDGATDAIASEWRAAVGQVGEIVLWWDRTTVPVLINAITADWTRIDLLILTPDQVARHAQNTVKPVFDPGGLYETLPEAVAPQPVDTKRFLYQVEEFIRVLGLLHLVDGREEYINGVLGVFHLRNQLVTLLIDETDAPNRGGMLHLNRLITDKQKVLLTALPPPVPEREAIIAAHLAYAQAYLPRARRRAAALGVDWPEAFEAATWAMLEKTVGVARPDMGEAG